MTVIGSLRVFSLALFGVLALGSYAKGQTIPFSFTGQGSAGNQNATGSGTGTFAGGPAAVSLSGGSYGDNCNSFLELFLKIQVSTTDTLTTYYSIPVPTDLSATKSSFSATSALTVTAGTGAYASKGGTGTASIDIQLLSASTFMFSITGTVSLAGPLVPLATVTPLGIVPVFSDSTAVQPGSWISIYGNNLANGTTLWNADFPTALGNVSVTIDGKPGYLWFVSPGQINLQVPDSSKQGCVPVSINTPNGNISLSMELRPVSPSLSLLDGKYVAAVILTPNKTGAYGGGTYDLAGPVGRFPYATRPVKRGETIELFGVGFGPTKTPVPAGKAFVGAADTTNTVQVYLGVPGGNGVPAQVLYSGETGAGLYQINLTIPNNAPVGDLSVVAVVGPPGNPNNAGTSNTVSVLIPVQ